MAGRILKHLRDCPVLCGAAIIEAAPGSRAVRSETWRWSRVPAPTLDSVSCCSHSPLISETLDSLRGESRGGLAPLWWLRNAARPGTTVPEVSFRISDEPGGR